MKKRAEKEKAAAQRGIGKVRLYKPGVERQAYVEEVNELLANRVRRDWAAKRAKAIEAWDKKHPQPHR